MTNPSHYSGFPRSTGPEQGWTSRPPKATSWMEAANCLGLESDLFFEGRDGDFAAAKAVCRACTVRESCLSYALTPPIERWGVFGGMTERERRRARAGRRVG